MRWKRLTLRKGMEDRREDREKNGTENGQGRGGGKEKSNYADVW